MKYVSILRRIFNFYNKGFASITIGKALKTLIIYGIIMYQVHWSLILP